MTKRLRRSASLLAVSLTVLGFSAACGSLTLPGVLSGGDSGIPVGAAQPGSVGVSTAANATATPGLARAAGSRTAIVTRGSITEALALDGMTAAQTQENLAYTWRTYVDNVKVKPNQVVKQGDILIDFIATEATRAVDTARARLQTSTGNLAKAKTDADAVRTAAAQRLAADQKQQRQAVLDAQIELSRAQENLKIVQAGRSATDKMVASTSVATYGQTQVAAAQTNLDKVLAGPDPETIKAAQRDVASAQLVLTKAKADFNALTRGPDPAAMRTAQAAVTRATTQLQVVQAAKIDPKAPDQTVAKIQHDQAVQDAQLALDQAQAQMTTLKQPPADVDVQAAKFRVTDAETNLSAAQAKVEALQAGPDQKTIDDAQAGLDHALHAMSELQASLDEVNSHPTPFELRTAQDQVRRAQAAFDNAVASSAAATTDSAGPNFAELEQLIARDQADLAAAEAAVENTHFRAPFDGTVVSVRVKAGDLPSPSQTVIVLARPGPPIVRVDLDDTQASRLVAGQLGTVAVNGGASAGPAADATVVRVTPAAKDGSAGATAMLKVNWADGEVPKFGTPVAASIKLQQKSDVLLVPRSAIRQAGGRTTVEVQDGTLRHLVSVQVGITAAEGVEIVNGLTEGQIVLTTGSA
jgi:multidrug resistance efflux pump